MKFYTDEQYKIISIDKEPPEYAHSHEEPSELAKSIFANMCDTCIHLHKHEPQYQVQTNDDGETVTDAFLNPIYILDDKGEKILTGWSTYPYVNNDTVLAIQAEHDAQETIKTDLQLALAEQYETNLLLQEETTNTQIALAEMYERKEA